VPRSGGGQYESNLWVGATSNVSRVEMEHGCWMGLWTGGRSQFTQTETGSWESTFQDLVITDVDIGIYNERRTRFNTFEDLYIEAHNRGIVSEWWSCASATDCDWNALGSHDNTYRDFYVDVDDYTGTDRYRGWCIDLDNGTSGYHFENGICDPGDKGISLPNCVRDPATDDLHHRLNRPDLANTVSNVEYPDGTPVPIVYHNRGGC
jgi:hypothetical protein